MLAPLALWGAVVLRRRRDGDEWVLWLLMCPVVCVAVTTVVFYGAHRIRSSMEASAILLGAIALAQIGARSDSEQVGSRKGDPGRVGTDPVSAEAAPT
jgi:hypothetical protein